jgi:hypothetical protein
MASDYIDGEFYTDATTRNLEEVDADRTAFMQKSPDIKVPYDPLSRHLFGFSYAIHDRIPWVHLATWMGTSRWPPSLPSAGITMMRSVRILHRS